MTSHRPGQLVLACVALGAVCLSVSLTGCADEPAPVVTAAPPPAPPPPPPPPKPTVTPVDQLMVDLSIDERVTLPEAKAPDTTEDRIAVLEFFDAFVRGDAQTLGSMMSALDRVELDDLAGTPAWRETIDGITEVVLETGPGPYGEKCALALFDVEGVYQPQLWYYKADEDGYRFDAVAAPPDIMDKLYGDDWITAWHELLEEEIALANALDPDLEMKKVDLDEGEPEFEEEPRGGGGRPSFGGGGGGSKDRRPTPPKRKPPGAR